MLYIWYNMKELFTLKNKNNCQKESYFECTLYQNREKKIREIGFILN